MKRLRLVPLVLLAACAHSSAPVATQADAIRAQARWPSITVDELNHGRSLFLGHCSSCHLPPKPTDHAAADWPGHVAEMRDRAGITDEEEQAIVRYVVTMASGTASSP